MKRLNAHKGRSETSGRRPHERSEHSGRRAPALVIRLEVGQRPSVVVDWDDDRGDQEFTAWLDECPRIASLAYMAIALAEEAAA